MNQIGRNLLEVNNRWLCTLAEKEIKLKSKVTKWWTL
jgi:hypothetical protein